MGGNQDGSDQNKDQSGRALEAMSRPTQARTADGAAPS